MALDTGKVNEVMHQFDADGKDWCGWTVHGSSERDDHVLITCDVPEDWARTMPGAATRQGIARHLDRYAEALRDAGFGTATWSRRQQPCVLIVAADPEAAEAIAPALREHLSTLNPEP